MKALTIAITLMLTLSGCEPIDRAPSQPASKLYGATHIEVWHDDQRAVTCWLYGGTNGGISCLPDAVLRK